MHGLGLIWSVPFILTLLAIALGPLFLKEIWEKHSFKILLIFPAILGVGMTMNYSFGFFLTESINSILHHYVPLISLLFALFTVTGGIYISVNKAATPLLNTAMLFISSLLAGWIGTTGAAMLFIRPLLNINKDRKNVTHIVIFFIFLVANIGGGFTPIGDPPLLMGFIEGVDFFWTLKHIGLIVLTTIVVLCTIYMYIPKIGLFNIILMFIISIFINLINSYLMLVVDLRKPYLNWNSEHSVIKKNVVIILYC